jgi:cytochrome P450
MSSDVRLPADADVTYDPYSYELDDDPYPIYRWMRDHAPVYRNEQLDFVAFTRFQDNLDAFLDWKTYSSAQGTVLELFGAPGLANSMIIFMDPPRQNRYRNLVSKAFTPARIRALEPAIRELAREHLAPLEGRPRFDIVKDFTAKLPMDVISTMLGIPKQDRDEVRNWSNALLHREPGAMLPGPEGIAAQGHLMTYFDAAIAERRARPRDDMMSLLVHAEVDDPEGSPSRLSDGELRAFFNLLATAGNETVTKLLATGFYWLERFPDERRALAADPSLAAGAVEELLRFDPPSHYQGRVMTRPAEVHGETLPEGTRVLLINGASGRDERKFDDPDRFDIRRKIDFHLGFGYGRHICLGAFLARMETRIGLNEVLARWPEYVVPEGGVERMHSSNVRGLSGLELEVAA